jgi:hypothetical protein
MIIHERPPNFEQIHAAFPRADGAGVMFAYDGNIYNPSGIVVPPALIAHENVHLIRQARPTVCASADQWWEWYINESDFRYNEELLAHVAEFKAQRYNDRNASARLLTATALRLVAPLYNYQPPRTLQQAMRDLRREIAQ